MNPHSTLAISPMPCVIKPEREIPVTTEFLSGGETLAARSNTRNRFAQRDLISTPQRIRTSNLRFRSRFQDVAEKLKNYVSVSTYNDAPVLQVVANRVKR